MLDGLLLLNVLATLAMVGVIWFVQVVHYPLFASVGRERFTVYEQQHQARTTLVVAPLMLAEAVSALLLVAYHPSPVSTLSVWLGLGLVVAMWLMTFFWQVPLHVQLSQAYDDRTHLRLVRSNWWRTGGWTLRGVLVLAMLAQTLA